MHTSWDPACGPAPVHTGFLGFGFSFGFVLFVSFLLYSCLHRLPFQVNEKFEEYQNHKRKKSLVCVAHRNDLDGHAVSTFSFSCLRGGLELALFSLKCIFNRILYIMPISHCGIAFFG